MLGGKGSSDREGNTKERMLGGPIRVGRCELKVDYRPNMKATQYLYCKLQYPKGERTKGNTLLRRHGGMVGDGVGMLGGILGTLVEKNGHWWRDG